MISEKLREINPYNEDERAATCIVMHNAADTIDALVAALEACRNVMGGTSPVWVLTDEEYDGIKSQANAALALARKGG